MARTSTTHARRRRGEGSIRPKGSSWEVRYLDSAGKVRSKSFTAERDGLAFLARANAARAGGDVVGGSQQRLADYLGDWLALHGPSVKPSTAKRHGRAIARDIVPVLGPVRVSDLRGSHVLMLHRAMRARGLAPGSIYNAHSTLGAALSAAVRDRLISHNPARSVERPSTPPRTVGGVALEPPTLGELQAVGGELHGVYQLAYRVTMATGCRIGELLALTWADVSTAGLVAINGSWSSDTRSRASTKSAAGARGRLVSNSLSGALAVYRADREGAGRAVGDGDYVFASDRVAGPLRHWVLLRELHAAQDRAGVRRFRWHDIRHAHATLMRERGDDLLVVSRAMGHSRLAVTAEYYGHVAVVAVAALELDAVPVDGAGTGGGGHVKRG